MAKKKINDFPTFDLNPSVEEVKFQRYPINPTKPVLITDKRTGDSYDADVPDRSEVVIGEWGVRDRTVFFKVFDGAEMEIGGLSSAAVKLLMFIMKSVTKDTDEFRIDTNRCMTYLGYKNKVSVYDGIIGLLDAKFIYRKIGLDGIYYLNVNKVFKGTRQELLKK